MRRRRAGNHWLLLLLLPDPPISCCSSSPFRNSDRPRRRSLCCCCTPPASTAAAATKSSATAASSTWSSSYASSASCSCVVVLIEGHAEVLCVDPAVLVWVHVVDDQIVGLAESLRVLVLSRDKVVLDRCDKRGESFWVGLEQEIFSHDLFLQFVLRGQSMLLDRQGPHRCRPSL